MRLFEKGDRVWYRRGSKEHKVCGDDQATFLKYTPKTSPHGFDCELQWDDERFCSNDRTKDLELVDVSFLLQALLAELDRDLEF